MIHEADTSFYSNDAYDKQACIRSCYQDMIMANASIACYDSRYPRPHAATELTPTANVPEGDPRVNNPSCPLGKCEGN